MLTTEQKKLIQKGFNIGLSDVHIARVVKGVNHMQVYNFRHKLKISAQQVVDNRYDVWAHLIYKGMSIKQISEIYGVTEQSVKVLLWKNREISLVEAKACAPKPKEPKLKTHHGLPDFKKYGL